MYLTSDFTPFIPLARVQHKITILGGQKEHEQATKDVPDDDLYVRLGRGEYATFLWCDKLVNDYVTRGTAQTVNAIPSDDEDGQEAGATKYGVQPVSWSDWVSSDRLDEQGRPMRTWDKLLRAASRTKIKGPASATVMASASEMACASPLVRNLLGTPRPKLTQLSADSPTTPRTSRTSRIPPARKPPQTARTPLAKNRKKGLFARRRPTSTSDSSDNASDHDTSSSLSEFETEATEPNSDPPSEAEAESDASGTRKVKRKRGPAVPRTPRKQAKMSTPSTPATGRKKLAAKVRAARFPTSLTQGDDEEGGELLAELERKCLPFGGVANAPTHERARFLLHVGSTPSFLPCRETEFGSIQAHMENALDNRQGGCLYVCGVPGTGKTATCRQVVRSLRSTRGAEFNFVEINGMKLAEASQVYTVLWSALRPDDDNSGRGANSALESLRRHFERGAMGAGLRGGGRKMTVVLLDEVDQLLTTRQEVLYNLFHWPHLPGARLLVLALANTMDLPQRALSARVASRLGGANVPFQPYDDAQLAAIVRSRLGLATEAMNVFPPPAMAQAAKGCAESFQQHAITLMAKRVAVVNGDARRMLDVARRALERAAASVPAGQPPPPVTISHVNSVFADLASSGVAVMIRSLPAHAKTLLWAALMCARKTGLCECALSDLIATHGALAVGHGIGVASTSAAVERARAFAHALLVCGDEETASREARKARIAPRPVSLEALQLPLAALITLGLLIPLGKDFGMSRAGPCARVLIAVREDEVRIALREDADLRFRHLVA